MYYCHSILECYNRMLSGVKLSMRSFCFITGMMKSTETDCKQRVNKVFIESGPFKKLTLSG